MIIKEGERPRLFSKNSKGQVTIFIIIAVVVIALVVSAFLFLPKLRTETSPETKNPSAYLDNCLKDYIKETAQIISLQGGDYEANKESSYLYRGEYVKYLCYSGDDFSSCINQQPFLMQHIESELIKIIEPEIGKCLDLMVQGYDERGYETQLTKKISFFEINPDKILATINYTLILTKGDETQKYENTLISINSDLYNLIEITNNIISWEINVGDSVSEGYMMNDPYIKVEKRGKENEIRLYTITGRNTKEVFRFAVRSFASPPGFPEVF